MFQKHYPFHLKLDDQIYFLTARTVGKIHFFNSSEKLEMLSGSINKAVKKYNIKIYSYVLLPNHYHLLLFLPKADDLPHFIRFVHGRSARQVLKALDGSSKPLALTQGWSNSESLTIRAKEEALTIRQKKVWWNYWDKCIQEERDFWIRFNYIHHNPVKHGYVKSTNQYQFSSYNYYLESKGQDWLDEVFNDYPVVDFHV